MAWGTPAGKRVMKVDGKRHLVLKSVHPSPLSASRGFFDCGHFKRANEWLVGRYGREGEVDWALVAGSSTKVVEEVVEGEVVEGGELKKVEAKVESKVEAKKPEVSGVAKVHSKEAGVKADVEKADTKVEVVVEEVKSQGKAVELKGGEIEADENVEPEEDEDEA